MPFSIPAYSLFQWQIPAPLKGNWNRKPPEGDKLLNAEIDWLSGTTNTALQFQVGGNSPVALSQIVALYVDNSRCGSDVTFWFPDTGFELVVPVHSQGLFPVFTNALLFYAIGNAVAAGDVTIVQVLNSLPPPIALLPAQLQSTTASAALSGTGTTQLIPTTVSGELNSINGSISALPPTSGSPPFNIYVALIEGQAGVGTRVLWQQNYGASLSGPFISIPIAVSGLDLRFRGGVFVQINVNGAWTSQAIYLTLGYSTP